MGSTEHMRDVTELLEPRDVTRRMPTASGLLQQPGTHRYLFHLYV